MQFLTEVSPVTSSLTVLKARSAKTPYEDSTQFTSLFETARDIEPGGSPVDAVPLERINLETSPAIPNWVDPDYGFDPQNPRKPNLRELIEKIANCSVEELYRDPNSIKVEKLSLASELLYGTVGSNIDTRDWSHIMASDDVVKAARQATNAMYSPYVDIVSVTNSRGELMDQLATINNRRGQILRYLEDDTNIAHETLINFGATSTSIPYGLLNQVDLKVFSEDLLKMLLDYESPYEMQSNSGN